MRSWPLDTGVWGWQRWLAERGASQSMKGSRCQSRAQWGLGTGCPSQDPLYHTAMALRCQLGRPLPGGEGQALPLEKLNTGPRALPGRDAVTQAPRLRQASCPAPLDARVGLAGAAGADEDPVLNTHT